MKKTFSLVIITLSLILTLCFVKQTDKISNLKNGDLIFITNKSGQGKAIQLATKSTLTHIGVVFIENNIVYVYHAVEPVTKSTLKEFIAYSEDNKYLIKRLKNQKLLTDSVIQKLKTLAKSKLGKHYDIYFNWSEDELYCSEFIWKLYKECLQIEIGKLRPLKDYDLSNPIVKSTMEKRYGKNIPYSEKMIAPSDMYNSDLVE
ncbi:MAG: YiiX family permuted papain-like enzyme [Bacteroidota bacterium]|nr:YiiX family permuted papain-like enzyme [Bacteroidota bacterium]